MLYTSLLALQTAVARGDDWNLNIGLIMLACNVLAFIIARFGIQRAGEGASPLPIQIPVLGKTFGLPEVLAAASFGHILGAGVILGLTNSGVL